MATPRVLLHALKAGQTRCFSVRSSVVQSIDGPCTSVGPWVCIDPKHFDVASRTPAITIDCLLLNLIKLYRMSLNLRLKVRTRTVALSRRL